MMYGWNGGRTGNHTKVGPQREKKKKKKNPETAAQVASFLP